MESEEQLDELILLSSLDLGGQNTVYLGKYKTFDKITNSMKVIDVVTKTPLVEKNPKFLSYLQSEHKLMSKLLNVNGVINCYGMKKITNQFTNREEDHLVL
jgi:hypothetical protein